MVILTPAALPADDRYNVVLMETPNQDREQRLADAERYYRSFSEEIRVSIDGWTEERPLPELGGEAGEFFFLRANTAFGFVSTLWTVETVLRCPIVPAAAESPETLVKWLLTDWYEQHGWELIFLRRKVFH